MTAVGLREQRGGKDEERWKLEVEMWKTGQSGPVEREMADRAIKSPK